MKKGFTLIELLAVIVILAIIALIATPIILNIIADTRESAKIRSAELYIDAIEQAIIREKMNNTSFNPSSCIVTNGVVICDGVSIQVEVDGTVPSDGTITLNNGKAEYYDLKFDDKYVVYENDEYTLQDSESFYSTEKYILKNNEVMNVIATKDNINTISLYPFSNEDKTDLAEFYYVILNDGSEWYLMDNIDSSSNSVKLLSKYNYFTSGANAGEMDPSGTLNPIVATSEVTDNYGVYSYDDEYITDFVQNTINPKLLNSLEITSLEVSIPITYIGLGQNVYRSFGEPEFWFIAITGEGIENFVSNYRNTPPDTPNAAGIRIKITIEKSYIEKILSKDKYYYDDELEIYYVSKNKYDFKKIKVTDEYDLYLSENTDNKDYVKIYDNSSKTVIGESNFCYEIVKSLGYESTYEDGFDSEGVKSEKETVILTNDIEGIDNEVVRSICGLEVTEDDDSRAIEIKIPKNS